MNTRGLLDQLLKSGQQLLQDKAAGSQHKKPAQGGLGGLLGGQGSGGLGHAAGARGL